MTRLAVHRPSPEDQQAIGQLIHDQMLTTVAVLSASLNTTGVSIVMVALSQWVKELEEIDAPQAAILLHSLADLVDPENDDAAREDAESRRKAAIDAIFQTTELLLTDPAGRG